MKRSSVRPPSVCPVDRQQERRAAGFAAARPAGRRYRSMQALSKSASQQSQAVSC